MKNLYTATSLFLLVFITSCAKEKSGLHSAEMASLYQHWALEFDKEIVTGVPFREKYPDASELTAGYEFFKDGEGIDYSYTPPARFEYEVTEQGAEKLLKIIKSIPTIQLATGNQNPTFEGTCGNNHSNGSGCNNTQNFNDAAVYSVEYETKTESFRIVQLTKVSLQGYRVN